jgi:CheY-like chemotaxis protein
MWANEHNENGKKTTPPDFEKSANIDRKLKVLVVEDDEASIYYFKQVLEREFEHLIFAETGKKALELFAKESPDIILMDIGLPDIGGLDVVRKIREQDKEVIIIAQTAFAMNGDEANALIAGCNDYISKPVRLDKLLQKLHRK